VYSCTRTCTCTAVHVHFVLSKINTLRKLVCSCVQYTYVYNYYFRTYSYGNTFVLSYESTKVRRYFRTPEVQLHVQYVRKYYLSSKVSCYEGNKLYCTVRVRVRVQLYTYEDNSTRTTRTVTYKYFRKYNVLIYFRTYCTRTCTVHYVYVYCS